MARIIKQFRYYNDNSNLNYPFAVNAQRVTINDYITGNIFNYPIYELGIQALPGTKFYLNGGSGEPVMIGITGIYELDFDLKNKITSLKFDSRSMQAIRDNDNAYLLVDVLYEDSNVVEEV